MRKTSRPRQRPVTEPAAAASWASGGREASQAGPPRAFGRSDEPSRTWAFPAGPTAASLKQAGGHFAIASDNLQQIIDKLSQQAPVAKTLETEAETTPQSTAIAARRPVEAEGPAFEVGHHHPHELLADRRLQVRTLHQREVEPTHDAADRPEGRAGLRLRDAVGRHRPEQDEADPVGDDGDEVDGERGRPPPEAGEVVAVDRDAAATGPRRDLRARFRNRRVPGPGRRTALQLRPAGGPRRLPRSPRASPRTPMKFSRTAGGPGVGVSPAARGR